MGARKLDDEGLDGRVLAGCADVLRVRRGSKVAADIIGDADVSPGAEATVPVRGIESAPERKPRRKLKLVGKDGQVVREVDDVALVGALAVRAEIETAKVTGGKPFILCSEPGCGRPRVVPKHSVGRVTRCKMCQREHDLERERQRSRERFRACMADPKVRERLCERQRERRADPKVRERERACVRKRMADPKVRERERECKRRRRRMADPEFRERERERKRAYRARKKAEREAAKAKP